MYWGKSDQRLYRPAYIISESDDCSSWLNHTHVSRAATHPGRHFSHSSALTSRSQPFDAHIKTTEQRTIILQYGDYYTGRWRVGCYIWYSEEGTGRGPSPSRPLLAIPSVTAHPPTASVTTSYRSMWHYNCVWSLKGWLSRLKSVIGAAVCCRSAVESSHVMYNRLGWRNVESEDCNVT